MTHLSRWLSSILVLLVCALPVRADMAAPKPRSGDGLGLVFTARNAESGKSETMYVVPARKGEMKAQPVLTRSSLGIRVVGMDQYVITDAGNRKKVIYRFSDGSLEYIKVLPGYSLMHEVAPGVIALSDSTFSGSYSERLRVQLLRIPSLKLEEISFPLKEAASENRFKGIYHYPRVSPDMQHLALYAQSVKADEKDKSSWSLVVLSRDESHVKVVDAELCPEWSPIFSCWGGPSLEWLSNHEVIYTAYRNGEEKRHSTSFYGIANVCTGQMYTSFQKPKNVLSPTKISRDPRNGEIYSGVPEWPNSRYFVYHISEDRSEMEWRRIPQRYECERIRDGNGRTEILRDLVKDVEIWRGNFPLLGRYYPSPDGTLLAFGVRPELRDSRQDIYIHDSRTGQTQKVFSGGYEVGRLWWVKAPESR